MAKTDTPMKIVVDCESGQTTETPLTADEIAQRDADHAAWVEQQAAIEAAAAEKAEAKESAKAKLAALGLTEAEIDAFLS